MIRSYRDLVVWQRAMALAEYCYRLTGALPPRETYGLSSQVRRSAVSVPANIAEGHARLHRKDYIRYLSIARGSLSELETLLVLCSRLHQVDTAPASALADETARMLNSLIRSLRRSGHPDP